MLLKEIQLQESTLSLSNARELLAQERRRAAGVQQGNLPQHLDRIERAEAAVRAAEQEAKALTNQDRVSQEQRDFHNTIAVKRATETPEENKERFGKAVSDGHDAGNEYRDAHGGWDGLAAQVHKYYQQASNYGADKVTAADIHKQFPKTTERNINRWLGRPEFTRTARMMGRR